MSEGSVALAPEKLGRPHFGGMKEMKGRLPPHCVRPLARVAPCEDSALVRCWAVGGVRPGVPGGTDSVARAPRLHAGEAQGARARRGFAWRLVARRTEGRREGSPSEPP